MLAKRSLNAGQDGKRSLGASSERGRCRASEAMWLGQDLGGGWRMARMSRRIAAEYWMIWMRIRSCQDRICLG